MGFRCPKDGFHLTLIDIKPIPDEHDYLLIMSCSYCNGGTVHRAKLVLSKSDTFDKTVKNFIRSKIAEFERLNKSNSTIMEVEKNGKDTNPRNK